MAKKKKTAPSTNRLTVRSTQAPKLVARPASETLEPAVAETPAPVVTITPEPPVTIDRALIAKLAFAKFVARGFVHGFHVADWLEAEAELRTTRR